ncbi:hypothetical protein SteCoe_22448 [Stentor coeruleus]|uniref:Uncharacterized protein n=1 Tax=Stentor coeruleus TaxID=5963 RepID=A0A1R2BMU0_9CILI|nr:hypothetical protein SteCoe_22448 [Stentor coeruleus]
METFPDTPMFAEKNNEGFVFSPYEASSPYSFYQDEQSFREISQGENEKNFSQDLKKNPPKGLRLDFSKIFNERQYFGKIISEINSWSRFCEEANFSEDFKNFVYNLQEQAQIFNRNQGVFTECIMVSLKFINKIQEDFKTITESSLPSNLNLENFWSLVCKTLESLSKSSKSSKALLNDLKSILKTLKKDLKSLNHTINLTDLPKPAKKILSFPIQTSGYKSSLPLFDKIIIKPSPSQLSDIGSLNTELNHLQSQLKNDLANAPSLVNKIINVKSKISSLKTIKTIKINRKLSEKVMRSLGNIEKSWIIEDKKSLRMHKKKLFSDDMTENTSETTSRSISPVGFQSSRSYLPEKSRVYDKDLYEKKYKEQNQALEIMKNSYECQEEVLKKTIADYKRKLEALDEEKNEIFKMKAKTFELVKKVKEYEKGLFEKEKYMKTSKREKAIENISDLSIVIEMGKEKNEIRKAQQKINEELEELHKEKLRVSKLQALVEHKYEAVKLLWPKISSMLSSIRL